MEEKDIRMNKENQYNQLKLLLKRIEKQDTTLEIPNPRVKENDYYDLIKYAIDRNFIKGVQILYGSNKPYLYFYQIPGVTVEGFEIIDTSYKKSLEKDNINNTFNFYGGNQQNSSFGNNNTTNN